jgi:hypothetical protein
MKAFMIRTWDFNPDVFRRFQGLQLCVHFPSDMVCRSIHTERRPILDLGMHSNDFDSEPQLHWEQLPFDMIDDGPQVTT